MSKKNNKKNLKKVQAKIGTTPVKTEAAKKEESKAAIKNAEIAAAKDDVKAKKKAEKKAHEEAKYAAYKARIEASKARKKQEERRNVAMARHIASITRRCKRMHLNDADTKKVIDIAKKQWDNATVYNITVVCDSILKKKKELEKLVKDCGIKSACITNSTAFFKNVPASVVAKLRDLVGNATFYQYRSDDKSPFEEAGIDMSGNHNKHKKGGDPHTIECSKNASVNFYNLRKAKKKAKETLEKNTYNFRHGSKAEGRKLRRELKVKAKAVNKKPTQVKEIKQKTAKQAA